jgi:hypothetical protein
LRFVIHLVAMFAVALVVGFGLSWFSLTGGRTIGAFEVGPWVAWPDIGVASPNPYTRAYLARTGQLELGTTEGLQFVAASDSSGQPLERACRYRIEGTTPVASFWTLAPVAPDGSSIARPDGPLAFNSTRLVRREDGVAVLYVSRSIAPLNWLEIAGDGPFSLVLTLYDTSIFTGVGSAEAELPAIVREACA